MAKNQPPTKTVKQPSLPDKITKFLHDNLKALSFGLLAIAVFGIAIVSYGYFQKNKELKIEAALFEERTKLTDLLKVEDEKKEKPNFEAIASAASNLEAKILNFDKSSAATTSALELAGVYLDYQKFDKAKSLLEKLQPKDGVLASLVNQQFATTLFEMKDYKGAIAKFDSIISSKADAFLHPDALLKKGLAFHQLGDMEKAKAAFKQVAEEYAEKPIANTANKYLRVMNFKGQSK